MTYVIPAPAQPALPITGQEGLFPVRRIFCVGQNYADHVLEMGSTPENETPIFFTKPADALVVGDTELPFPPATENLHHEAELVVAIGTGGADIAAPRAMDHIWGYAPGNDLTRRDLQAAAKAKGRPWDMAKGFDNSAVCGALVPAETAGDIKTCAITAHVNGALRQSSVLSDMIWPVAEVIAHLSQLVALAPGDLIYTGTPAGVGPLHPGDTCTVTIEGLGTVTTRFTA